MVKNSSHNVSVLLWRWHFACIMISYRVVYRIDSTRNINLVAILVRCVVIIVVLVVIILILVIFVLKVVIRVLLVLLGVLKWALLHLADLSDSPLNQVVAALLSFHLVALFFIVRNVERGILDCFSVLFGPLPPQLWMLFAPRTLLFPRFHV